MNSKFSSPSGKLSKIIGKPLALIGDDIDTDRIIPARFLKCVSFDHLGEAVFADDRKNLNGNHPFDLEKNQEASILIVNSNFGCGSSREHAPWALADFGIKCIISTSFADIFYNNSFKNGLLPIKVSKDQRDALLEDAKDTENPELEIDLKTQEIRRPNGAVIKFELDPFRKKCLMEGLDDIGITLKKEKNIKEFEHLLDIERPWL